MSFRPSFVLACVVAGVSAPSQDIVFAEGTPTALRIATVPEGNPNAPDTIVLQNVELLDAEITGRTLAQEFETGRSRRIVRHGVARVELPGGGRLFRYRRAGGQHWGFLHVAADGAASVVLERPGVGVGLGDPFAGPIAVAANGLHMVVALAGGGLLAVNLDGSLFTSTGRADRMAAPAAHLVAPTSPLVGPTHFFYVAGIAGSDHVFRCALADGGVPVDITPPSSPLDRLKDEMAMSGDGMHIVFLHGPQQQMRLWHATTSGPAGVLPPPPSKYEEPNYLPGGAGAPAMALSDDGSRLFYVDAQVRDELFLLDMAGVLPTLQITDDGIFQPYIGVFILPKFHGTGLLLAIGDPGQMDWFVAALDPVGGTVDNLTDTGSPIQPFPAGTLSPVTAADTGARIFSLEQTANGMSLRSIDATTGATAVVQTDTTLAIRRGSSFGASADTVVGGATGDRLYAGPTSLLLGSTPAGVALSAPAHGPLFSATFAYLQPSFGAPIFYLADGTILPGLLESGLRQIVLTQTGGVILNGASVRYLSTGGMVVLQRPAAAVRFVLSGAGG